MKSPKNGRDAADMPALCEHFFSDWLKRLRDATQATINTYATTFKLFLPYLAASAKRPIDQLCFSDCSPEVIQRFLIHLVEERHNSRQTRNLRLAAIHSFCRAVMLKEPKYAHLCQRILTISGLRVQRTHIPYLDRSQLNAVLNVVKRETWVGERNFTLMLFAAQTGLRNSELLSLRRSSIAADWGTVRCVCKGQEDRVTPIPKQASRQLQSWINRISTDPSALLFPDKNGRQLSADSFQFLTRKYKLLAQVDCPSLRNIRVTPHVFRHTCAMMLIEAGVDIYSVSRWLGHKSIDTTARYLECNLAMKRKALTAFTSQDVSPSRTPLFKGKTLDFLQRTCSPVAILDAQGNRLGKN